MGGTETFPDLGRHCSYPSCGQLDFLPFKCDCCTQTFCLEHRSYNSHDCAKAAKNDISVIICPVCAITVRKIFGEDPNVTLGKHLQSKGECDPSNYARVMKKPKCSVNGCRQPLTFSNKYHCKDCGRDTCLKHRFYADHACKTASGTDLPSKFLRALSIRSGTECANSSSSTGAKPSSSPGVKVH